MAVYTGHTWNDDYFMGCDSCASEEKCAILKSLKLRCGLVGGVDMKITKCRKFEEKEIEPIKPIESDANGMYGASVITQMNNVQSLLRAQGVSPPYYTQSQSHPYDQQRSQGCSNTIPLNSCITTTGLNDSEKALPPYLIQSYDKVDDTVEMESTMKRLWGRLKNAK